MKQWLNTPVTIGCVIRILLIYGFVFLIFVFFLVAVLNVGGPHWTAISLTSLTVVGILIALGQWLIPFTTDQSESKEASNNTNVNQVLLLLANREKNELEKLERGTGTLVIWAKQKQDETVYLLDRNEFVNCRTGSEREKHRQKKIGTMTGEVLGTQLLYSAIFRGLKPARYSLWTMTDYGKDKPKHKETQIHSGLIAFLEFSW